MIRLLRRWGAPGSLRARLLTGSVLVTACALLAVDVTAFTALRWFLDGRTDATLNALAGAAERSAAQTAGRPVEPTRLTSLLPGTLYTAAYTADGRRVVLSGGADPVDGPQVPTGGVLAVPQQPVTVGGGASGYRIRSVVFAPGSRPQLATTSGSVQVTGLVVGASRETDVATLDRLLGVEIIASAAVMVLAVVAGNLVLRRGLRPLRAVTSAVRQIGTGHRREVPVADPASEVGAVAVALNDAFAARAAGEDRVRQFAADASHELRTPLATVSGWADLYLQGGIEDWPDVDVAMHGIHREASRMSVIVEDLLLLARLDAGQVEQRSEVDLTALGHQAAAAALVLPGAADRAVTAAAGVPVHVHADPVGLRRAVDNLVANALTHTPPGATIRIATTRRGGRAELEVVDDGPGLTAAELTHARDRFWRADRSRATPGSGLGLAIVHELVTAHGGRLELRSDVGAGLCASVVLPVADGPPRSAGDRQQARSRASDTAATVDEVTSDDLLTRPVPDPPATAAPPGRLHRLGAWCARHAWWVVAAWLVVLVAAGALNQIAGGSFSDDASLPSGQANTGLELLDDHGGGAGGATGQVVFRDPGGLRSQQTEITQSLQDLRAVEHVSSVTDPFGSGAVSADGTVAYAVVHVDERPTSLGDGFRTAVDDAVAPVRGAGVEVEYGSALGDAFRPHANDARAEAIGIAVALLVLLIGFGSVFAAILPIVSAALATVVGLSVVGVVAGVVTLSTSAPTLAVMIGLGVGIDYALFLTTRFRQLVHDGYGPVDAAGRTAGSSGHAVLVAAATVAVALLGLYASGIAFVGKLGLASVVTVATAAAAAVTLVPAALGLTGRHIDRVKVRRRTVAETGSDGDRWHRYARAVSRRPWWFLVAGVVVLLALSAPLLSIRLGHVDESADPTSYTDRRAHDLIADGFGPGANGPFTVVVADPRRVDPAALQQDLRAVPGVAAVTMPAPSADGAVLVSTVTPTTEPQDGATEDTFHRLVDDAVPNALDGTGAHGYVTGATASQYEFRDAMTERLPVIIAVVVGLAIVLLLVEFRSVAIAVKAGLLNLLSISAAYGVVVAVFQWGWGGSLLGVAEQVPIESYVPMMMFAIVFGLSMDYEVFLLTRVREEYRRTGNNTASVAHGLSVTGRVITCAALIMASVFFAFVGSSTVVIKMLAVGLAVSVVIDATLVRMVLVPSTMTLLGRWNWWMPRWLGRRHRAQRATPPDTAA